MTTRPYWRSRPSRSLEVIRAAWSPCVDAHNPVQSEFCVSLLGQLTSGLLYLSWTHGMLVLTLPHFPLTLLTALFVSTITSAGIYGHLYHWNPRATDVHISVLRGNKEGTGRSRGGWCQVRWSLVGKNRVRNIKFCLLVGVGVVRNGWLGRN